MGDPECVQRCCDDVVKEKAKLLNTIPKLTSLQAAWLLLYFCAVPRVNHLLRNVPPVHAQVFAHSHDANVLGCFREIFQIPSGRRWDDRLHKVSFGAWVKQARLPLRLGGCGLRNSNRTSHAAYWASWADCMPDLIKRFPHMRHDLVGEFAALQALDADEVHAGTACLVAAEMAGKWCQEQGWHARPLWVDIANGTRPPERVNDIVSLGNGSMDGSFMHLHRRN